MSSNLAVEEPMAADPAKNPGGDELREEIPAVKSSEKVEVEEETAVAVTETKGELTTGSELGSEDKSGKDLQGNDLVESKDVESGSVGDAEEGNDPTAISLHDLTGGLDMDGKPTEVDIEEAVTEGSVENEANLGPGSSEVAGEGKDRLVSSSDEQIGVPESGPAATVLDEQKLEESVVKETGSVEGGQKDKIVEEAGECASEKELGEELEKEKGSVDDGGETREVTGEAATVGQPEEVAGDVSDKPNVDEGLAVEENEEVDKATSDSCIGPMDVDPPIDVGIEQGSVGILEQVTEGEQHDNAVLHTHIQKAEVGADVETSQYGERNTDNEEKPESSLQQDNIVQGITHVDGKEAVVYHRREKHSFVRNATLSAETHKEETIPGDIHVTYDLTSVEKDGFAIYDLVWGKVKSHPWWPGVIISPSDGSNLAMKFKKKDSFLVAYFGDKTFAWCDESQLKPFFPNFSHYEKQATTDAFSNAVKSVLVEVCRRFDVGMICSCLEGKQFSREIYPKLENAGVKQGFVNCAVDTHEIVNYFNPKGLVDFIKDLAVVPTMGTTDRLELVMTTSQVKAFYRMKGYSVCPKFHTFGPLEEYVEPVIESSESEELPEISVMEVQTPPILTPPSVTTTMNNYPVELSVAERPKKKRGRPPKKKKEELDIEVQKPLSELVRKKVHSDLSNGSQSNSKPERATTDEEDSASPLPWKKRKEVVGFELVEHENQVQTPRSGGFGISFKIGECISRAASRLTGPGSGSTPLISTPKFDSADFDVSSDDETPMPAIHEEKRVRKRRLKKYQYSDPKDILLQLCIVATGPTKEYSNLSTVISYFTDFRNFTVNPPPSTETCYLPDKVKSRRGRKRKVDLPVTPFDEVVTMTDHMQDSYWSDMILCGQTEEPSTGPKQRKRRVSIETKHLKLTPGGPDEKRALAVAAAATKRPIIRVEEKRQDECNPTALLLSFGTRYGTIPSEMDIVRIFSRYGPLKEWEMGKLEGGTNRVWIVFKRRSDAEMAFSNLRKQNVFGPSLVSYRLVYELHDKSEQEKKIEVPNGEEHFELKAPEETVSLPTVTQGDDATADLLRNATGVDAHAMLVGPLSNVKGSDNVDEISVDLSSNVESIDADVCALINPSNDVVMVDVAQDNHMDEMPVDLSGNVEDINVDEMSIDPPSTAQVEDVGDVSITPNTALDEAAGPPSSNAASTVHVAADNEVLMKEFGSTKDGSAVVEPTELSSSDEVTIVKSIAPSCEVQGTAAALVSATESKDSETVANESNTVPSQNCGDSDQPSILHSEGNSDVSIVQPSAEEHKVFVEAPVDDPPTKEGKDVDVMPVETNNTEGSEVAGEEGEVVGEVLAEPGNTEQGEVADDVPVEPASSEHGIGDGEMPVQPSSADEGKAVYKMSVEPTSTGQGEVAQAAGEVLVEASGEQTRQVEPSRTGEDKVVCEMPVEPASTGQGEVAGEVLVEASSEQTRQVEPSGTGEDEVVCEMPVEPASTGQHEVVGEASIEASNVHQGEDVVGLSVDPSSTAESDVFGESPVQPSQVEDCKVQDESAETIQADEKPVQPSPVEDCKVQDESAETIQADEKTVQPSPVEDCKVQDESAETIQPDEKPVQPSPVEDCKVQDESAETIQAQPSSPEEGEVVGDESLEPSSTEQGEVIGTVEKDAKLAEESVEKPACTAEHFT